VIWKRRTIGNIEDDMESFQVSIPTDEEVIRPNRRQIYSGLHCRQQTHTTIDSNVLYFIRPRTSERKQAGRDRTWNFKTNDRRWTPWHRLNLNTLGIVKPIFSSSLWFLKRTVSHQVIIDGGRLKLLRKITSLCYAEIWPANRWYLEHSKCCYQRPSGCYAGRWKSISAMCTLPSFRSGRRCHRDKSEGDCSAIV